MAKDCQWTKKIGLTKLLYIYFLSSCFIYLLLLGKILYFNYFFSLESCFFFWWKEIMLVLLTLLRTKNCRRKFHFPSNSCFIVASCICCIKLSGYCGVNGICLLNFAVVALWHLLSYFQVTKRKSLLPHCSCSATVYRNI